MGDHSTESSDTVLLNSFVRVFYMEYANFFFVTFKGKQCAWMRENTRKLPGTVLSQTTKSQEYPSALFPEEDMT